MRGATPRDHSPDQRQAISIHAPHAGRDTARPWRPSTQSYFNPRAPCGARRHLPGAGDLPAGISIHAPRAGRDNERVNLYSIAKKFQSTRPVRGATYHYAKYAGILWISIHAPRAGRDSGQDRSFGTVGISIHAPRAGRDPERPVAETSDEDISIHAPRAGRDLAAMLSCREQKHFNPRAPCGARLS